MGDQLRLELEPAADTRRDRFIVSTPNREAVEMLNVWPDERGGTLALIGPAGAGKTSLALAWAERTRAEILDAAALAAELFAEAAGALVLDEADGVVHGETFFHLLNWAVTPGRALLLTSRTSPKSWPVEVPDLRSRLNAMPVIQLGEPDDVILRGLLVKLFQQRSIRPPQDLLAYLLLRMERSAPAAQAMVAALDEKALADHRAVSRALAREILQDEADDIEG